MQKIILIFMLLLQNIYGSPWREAGEKIRAQKETREETGVVECEPLLGNERIFNVASMPPLNVAVNSRSIRRIQHLLDARADPNTPDLYGNTALHVATILGDVYIVKMLLNAGADIRKQNKVGDVPAQIALTYQNYQVWHTLFAASFEADGLDEEDLRELQRKIIKKSGKIWKVLTNANRSFNQIRSQSRFLLQTLLHFNDGLNDVDEFGNTALMQAIKDNDLLMFAFLIKEKVDISIENNIGENALHLATIHERCFFVSELIKAKADINKRNIASGMSALDEAIVNGNEDVVKVLLSSRATVSSVNPFNGYSALHFAVQMNRHQFIARILNAGANIDLCDKLGCTALHLASDQRYSESIAPLLFYKASTDILDVWGNTAFDMSVLESNPIFRKRVISIMHKLRALEA